MKVLALVHKYPPVHNAGAEVMLHAMLVDLARRGHSCTVTYPKAKPDELDGIPIVPTPPRDVGLLEAARAADVLITHLDVTPRAMRVSAAAGRPLVHLVHNDGQLPFHGVTADRAELVVWNSEWIADKYERWAGRTTLVRPPVPVADYELEEPAGPDGAITLVNLTQAKGAGTFKALARMLPERRFLAVQGAYGTQDQDIIRKRAGYPNVDVVEHVPSSSMRELVYARTRILLVPSSYESWGRVAVEAMAAGIPVIAHPTPGLLESLGTAGLFAEHGRAGQWARLIAQLDDPGFYAERVELGRARARELEELTNGDLDRFALRLEELTETYARPDDAPDRSPMAILSTTSSAGRQCPVCGARDCACGTSGIAVHPPTRKGLPIRTYRTGAGHFRLNEDDARRRGLLPDGPNLPTSVAKALRLAEADVRAHGEAYARAGDEARESYLEAVHALRRPALADRAEALLEELKAAPPAPADPEDPDAPPLEPGDELRAGARVGEVLDWAGDDPLKLTQALEEERSRPTPRPTLVAELERLLEAAE